jgi:hypothetical protein
MALLLESGEHLVARNQLAFPRLLKALRNLAAQFIETYLHHSISLHEQAQSLAGESGPVSATESTGLSDFHRSRSKTSW